MNLTRCKDQTRATLDEFYGRARNSDEPVSRKGGQAMLDLIARLRAWPDDRNVFGLTSLNRLCLLSQDTYTSPWFVIVCAVDAQNYYIDYLMPEREAPWPHARVQGEARSVDDAVRMIITAMEKSGGWG
jgi:hypothetical protein